MPKRKISESTEILKKIPKQSAVSSQVSDCAVLEQHSEETNSYSTDDVIIANVDDKETACEVVSQKDVVMAALRIVCHAATYNWSNVRSLYELQKLVGVPQLKNLDVDEIEGLSNDNSTREFQFVVSQYLEKQLMDKINKSQLYSLLVDESIDASYGPIVMVYIRILEQEGLQWVPRTYFLGLRHVDYDDAENVPNAILSLLKDKGLSLEFLSGIAIDGASELLGCKTGIVASLKVLRPGLLASQCIAHRLALSCGDAADRSWYLIQFQIILNSVYVRFLNSHQEGLEDIGRIIDRFRNDILGKILGMNWLGVDGSVPAILTNYSALLSVLMEEDFEHFPETLRLHEQLSSYKFLYCAYFLFDVLNELFILYKFYQKPDIDYSKVNPMLRSTIRVLEELRDRKSGVVLGELLKVVPAEVAVDGFTFQGHLIKDSYKKRDKAVKACNDFVNCTVDNLKSRLLEKGDSSVLSALSSLFSPVVGELCKDKIVVIREYVLKLGMDPVDFEQEVVSFRTYVQIQIDGNAERYKSIDDIIQLSLGSAEMFPIIANLAKRLVVMPVSTVDIERGFSIKKDLCRELEKTLTDKEVENLLRIQIDGQNHKQEIDHEEDFEPTEKIDYDEVFKLWKSKPRNVLV